SGSAEVGAPLQRTRGQQALVRVAGAGGKRADAGGDVVKDPMPPAAAGGRVRVMHQQCEAPGAGGRIAPGQRRRDVAALAAEAVEHLALGNLSAGGDIRAARSEEHTSELQSRGHLVCRLLLEKKKKKNKKKKKLINSKKTKTLMNI